MNTDNFGQSLVIASRFPIPLSVHSRQLHGDFHTMHVFAGCQNWFSYGFTGSAPVPVKGMFPVNQGCCMKKGTWTALSTEWLVYRLDDRGIAVRFRSEERHFLLSSASRPAPWPTLLLTYPFHVQGGSDTQPVLCPKDSKCSLGLNNRSLALTIHLHLTPRMRMSTLKPRRAFIACCLGTRPTVKCTIILVRVRNWNPNNTRITNFVSNRFSPFSKSFILNICKHHYAKHVYFTWHDDWRVTKRVLLVLFTLHYWTVATYAIPGRRYQLHPRSRVLVGWQSLNWSRNY